MPTDDELREQVLAVLNRPEHAPMSTHDGRDGSCTMCPVPLYELGPEEVADAILPIVAKAVAERERCARIAGAETDFTDVIHAEAHRRYPVDHIVDDPFGATGEARSDPYGYDEYARGAFLAGALFQHENERTRRLRDAAAIRADDREEADRA